MEERVRVHRCDTDLGWVLWARRQLQCSVSRRPPGKGPSPRLLKLKVTAKCSDGECPPQTVLLAKRHHDAACLGKLRKIRSTHSGQKIRQHFIVQHREQPETT